jgi:hypothetical protein
MNTGPLGELVGTRVAYERHQCGALTPARSSANGETLAANEEFAKAVIDVDHF